MKRHKKITRTPGEWVLDIVKVVFLAFVVVVTVYPFWNIFTFIFSFLLHFFFRPIARTV